MAQQTVMQELINEIVEHLTYDDDLSDDSRIAYETIRLRCLSKLSMEKEQIIKTYNNAISKMDYFIQPESAEQYYNETYNK